MTDLPTPCAHEACTCVALTGDFCSDHCRTNAGEGSLSCACGHKDCAGSAENEAVAS